MNEIRNGFPLKKRGLSVEENSNTPRKLSAKGAQARSKLNWKKTKALASFVSKF